jgi:hypothetical protein
MSDVRVDKLAPTLQSFFLEMIVHCQTMVFILHSRES